MSKKDRKRQRRAAEQAEINRRQEDCKKSSPFTRDELLDLIFFVSEKYMRDGRTSDFTYTKLWLDSNGFDEELSISFLNDIKINDDWSLCMEGDPYALFGTSADRLSWMPIESAQLEALTDYLDAGVQNVGCKHNLALTKGWLEKHRHPVYPTLMALMAHGGFCDCEVVMNVEPEYIYPLKSN